MLLCKLLKFSYILKLCRFGEVGKGCNAMCYYITVRRHNLFKIHIPASTNGGLLAFISIAGLFTLRFICKYYLSPVPSPLRVAPRRARSPVDAFGTVATRRDVRTAQRSANRSVAHGTRWTLRLTESLRFVFKFRLFM